ncbi:unnamed protein product [Ceratitis capitata]|uniref:(Mediterranean fruit fly) hypothetical protein n=1 Tax=Ceratitis capitata TaxID=7213 RepID=A0A811UMK7_CERCA|nr:unnamed protein product [Ceratitis capitata]
MSRIPISILRERATIKNAAHKTQWQYGNTHTYTNAPAWNACILRKKKSLKPEKFRQPYAANLTQFCVNSKITCIFKHCSRHLPHSDSNRNAVKSTKLKTKARLRPRYNNTSAIFN